MLNENMIKLGTERSAIRELFEKGKVLKEKYGRDAVFDFSLGNPSIPCPKDVNDTLINLLNNANFLDQYDDATYEKIDLPTDKIIEKGRFPKYNSSMLHGYTQAQGDKTVRVAISNYLNKTYDAKVDPDFIYMTVGAAAGLTITLKAVTNSPDNEIITFAPFFPEYAVFIKNAGAKMVSVNPDKKTFCPDLNDFKNKINNNTAAVILNSPNNPTGVLYKEDIIRNICDILNEKQKEFKHPIYIISDEPYRELLYIDCKYPFITNYYDNSIVTYSFSKSISLPGERIGYIVVNKNATDSQTVYSAVLGAGRSLGFVCAPTLFQFLLPQVIGITSDISIYKKNAELIEKNLTEIGYEVIKPDGAFYLFVKALEADDEAFSKKALDYNLLIVPSKSFGISGYVRIAYCVKEKQIIDSMPKFKELYDFYKSKG